MYVYGAIPLLAVKEMVAELGRHVGSTSIFDDVIMSLAPVLSEEVRLTSLQMFSS